MPFLVRMALPPDPWCWAVRCAMDKVGFQPRVRAWRWAESIALSVRSLVSCARIMSAEDLLNMACLSESHELALEVSMAHRPLGTHHLSLLTRVPRGSTQPLQASAPGGEVMQAVGRAVVDQC